MTVKLDSLKSDTIEVELTHAHTNSLRKAARNAGIVSGTYTISREEHYKIADAAFDAIFKLLGEWADQRVEGCCGSCGGAGHVGGEACSDCLGTGHAHSFGVPCPNKVDGETESWQSVHARGIAMRDEATNLIHLAMSDMRCPHRVEETGGLVRRCTLNIHHKGDCSPIGNDTVL